jgi:S1-C subfamily serine protease
MSLNINNDRSVSTGSKTGRKDGLIITMVTVAALLVLLLAGCTASNAATLPQTGNLPATSGPSAALYDENAVVSLYQRSIPSVVQIETVVDAKANTPNIFGLPTPTPRQQRGQGSGFFIDNEGHILTNNHVVDGATKVTITLSSGKTSEAKVIGTDRQNDLALIQATNLGNEKITALPMGDSDTLLPGQMAIALGSPYGLQGSVTVGIVSGVGRSLPSDARRTITNVIQTDAAINPGNSGGPLLNSRGEVIGINTAIEAQSNNIGFAVPIKTAKSLLPALLKGGQIKSPWLGISGMAIDRELMGKLSLPVENGIYVLEVTGGGPAEKAGLKGSGSKQGEPSPGGDIITAVDTVTVKKVEDLITYFNGKQPGDTVSLSIYRDGNKQSLSAVLGEWPDQPANVR